MKVVLLVVKDEVILEAWGELGRAFQRHSLQLAYGWGVPCQRGQALGLQLAS